MKLEWIQAPVKTQWGDEMVVASVEIDKDHTVCLYCERDQTDKVEAMFKQRTWQGLTEDNGGKTGWPPSLLQDDHSGLSRWLASKPDARQKVREALAQRTWVGLTDEEREIASWTDGSFGAGARWAEAKLKEKNT